MGALALLYRGAEWIYLFSGGLTGAYMVKLYICLFWEKAPDAADCLRGEKAVHGQALRAGALPERGDCAGAGAHANLTMDKIADIAGGFLNAAAPRTRYTILADQHQGRLHLAGNRPDRVSALHPHEADEEGKRRARIRRSRPSWLDIEDRLYRPAIGGLLELGGRFAGWAVKRRWKPTCIAR